MIELTWDELLPPGCLPEKRLRERAVNIGMAMTARPGAAMTGAYDSARGTRAAYEFFENLRMSLPVLLDPATRALGRGLQGLEEGTTVLCVQDTTELNLSHLTTMEGLGAIGNPKNRGVFAHVSLAVGTDGVPLGLLATETWIRPVAARGKAKKRRRQPFEEKESVRWWRAMEHTEERVHRPGLLVHVGDRESDIYEVFARSGAKSFRLLVRSAHDRKVDAEEGLLWAQVGTFSPSEQRRTIHVPERRALPHSPTRAARKARTAREATVRIQFGPVKLCAPHGAKGTVALSAVHVFEVDPPEGVEPVEWMLLTSDPLASEAEAWLRVDWYRCRWVIEEFFKVLKSGCRVEERQFESRATFEVSFGLSLLASVQLLALTKRARIDPEQPASTTLLPVEQEVLLLHAETHNRRPAGTLRLRDAVVLIAKLGGYLGRKNDGPPGWLTLWRGLRRLYDLVEGYKLMQTRTSKKDGASGPRTKHDPKHGGIWRER